MPALNLHSLLELLEMHYRNSEQQAKESVHKEERCDCDDCLKQEILENLKGAFDNLIEAAEVVSQKVKEEKDPQESACLERIEALERKIASVQRIAELERKMVSMQARLEAMDTPLGSGGFYAPKKNYAPSAQEVADAAVKQLPKNFVSLAALASPSNIIQAGDLWYTGNRWKAIPEPYFGQEASKYKFMVYRGI